MEQSTTTSTTFTPCASLAALGLYLRHIDLLAPIADQVTIMQKTVLLRGVRLPGLKLPCLMHRIGKQNGLAMIA